MHKNTQEQGRSHGIGMPKVPAYEDRLCDTIGARRKALGMTQSQLADILGVSQQTVSKWEGRRAVPDVAMFPLIAETLEMPNFGSVDLANLPRWDHIPNVALRRELESFRRIISLRDVPWLMPSDLHANPLDVEGRGWEPCREQVAYETARILSTEVGLDVSQACDLQLILWILTCVPGGSTEDIPLFLWSKSARQSMRYFAFMRAGFGGKVGAIDRLCDDLPGERGDSLRSALAPVLDNPYVIHRISSIWHPSATATAMCRERDARNDCFTSDCAEPEDIRTHAKRIASWDGRHDCCRPTADELMTSALRTFTYQKLTGGGQAEDVAREFDERPDDVMREFLDSDIGAWLVSSLSQQESRTTPVDDIGDALPEAKTKTLRSRIREHASTVWDISTEMEQEQQACVPPDWQAMDEDWLDTPFFE